MPSGVQHLCVGADKDLLRHLQVCGQDGGFHLSRISNHFQGSSTQPPALPGSWKHCAEEKV